MVLCEHPGLMVGLGPHGWAGGLRAFILLRKHKGGEGETQCLRGAIEQINAITVVDKIPTDQHA